MCGIAGFISNERKPKLIENFIDDLHHRGPDSSSYEIIEINGKYLHLGSSRLAIRGGEKENMPLCIS
jgi:asparagine synthetase B (glutamine-hydrolysing)